MDLKTKGKENYNSAVLLKNNEYYRASCSRYYYACFLKLKHICENKLNFDNENYENKGSHEAIIIHFEKYINDAKYDDVGKLSKARKIPQILFSAKNIRKIADYEVEETIDFEKCEKMHVYYQRLNDCWSDINEIIDFNVT